MHAERRLGELTRAQKETVGLRGPQHSRGGGSGGFEREPLPDAPPTPADAGIDKKLSSRAQKLAATLRASCASISATAAKASASTAFCQSIYAVSSAITRVSGSAASATA